MNDFPRKLQHHLAAHRGLWIFATTLAVAALVGAGSLGRGEPVQNLGAKVLEGDIRDEVEASGTVNPVITVQVGSQVSGTITRLNADFNSHVRKGEVIALITPELFQGAVLQASADLADMRASVTVAAANLSKAQAALTQTRSDQDRAVVLAAQRIASQQALEQAQASFLAARAEVDAAGAAIGKAKAQVQLKDAALAVARTNLDYTIIRSPIDGTVVARNVDVGQTVAASLTAPTLFTIAQDLTRMQVDTSVDESDVGRIGLGRPVSFKVDAYPKEVFQGRVSQIRMNPTRVQNVVTYDAVVEFANPDLKLLPGMTAYVTIPVATAVHVAMLPNAALRYRPAMTPEAVRALLAKYRITAGSGPGQALVWKLRGDGSLEPVAVTLGITDHTYTELTGVPAGSLKPGEEVVTTTLSSKTPLPGARK
jgi:HlyD family secretion protein